jgi:hypothetical protein
MNASAVLAQLKAAGVHVAVAGGKLELEGPKEALNEDVLNELRAIKAELIKLLSVTEPAPASRVEARRVPGARSARFATVFYLIATSGGTLTLQRCRRSIVGRTFGCAVYGGCQRSSLPI